MRNSIFVSFSSIDCRVKFKITVFGYWTTLATISLTMLALLLLQHHRHHRRRRRTTMFRLWRSLQRHRILRRSWPNIYKHQPTQQNQNTKQLSSSCIAKSKKCIKNIKRTLKKKMRSNQTFVYVCVFVAGLFLCFHLGKIGVSYIKFKQIKIKLNVRLFILLLFDSFETRRRRSTTTTTFESQFDANVFSIFICIHCFHLINTLHI